jgi:8-oxo-dGTP pyrophosphatase MutT (NUDIX family)
MRLLAQHSPAFDPATPWIEQEAVLVGQTSLFQQYRARRRSPHTARVHDFTRLLCPAWVNVVAFTALDLGGELLLVEQFRHGVDASTLETIGGVCDPGEDPAVSAERELLEETGFRAGRWVALGSCAPNPAIQNNRCHFFLALDCVPVAELDLDPSEELRVWAVAWAEAERLLRERVLDHALVMAAMLRLFLWPGWESFRRALVPATFEGSGGFDGE